MSDDLILADDAEQPDVITGLDTAEKEYEPEAPDDDEAPDPNLTCDICGMVCSSRPALGAHKKYVHKIRGKTAKAPTLPELSEGEISLGTIIQHFSDVYRHMGGASFLVQVAENDPRAFFTLWKDLKKAINDDPSEKEDIPSLTDEQLKNLIRDANAHYQINTRKRIEVGLV